MKRILVPIDFSTAAENALQYAIELNKPIGAEIVCLHVTTDVSQEKEAKAKLAKLIEESAAAVPPQLAVKGVVMTGIPDGAIIHYLDMEHIDLIVMGTKGTTGFQKFILGSHTTDILASTELPVLIVPQGFVFRHIHYVLLASDFQTPHDTNSLSPMIAIAQAFGAEVRIAHVKRNDDHGNVLKHLELSREGHLLSAEGVKYSLKKIHWTDITGGIKYYLELKGDNDMLVMTRRKHGFMDRIFRRDHPYEFACEPTLPLLIVHE